MKFIYARMPGYDWVSTPSDAVVREMENLGHRSVWVDNLSQVPHGHYDFVFSPYESVTLLGDALAKKFDIIHYAHIEVIPPWRIMLDADYENYGIFPGDPEYQIAVNSRNHYLSVLNAWSNANIISISNHCRTPFHHQLLQSIGKDRDIYLRYPSIDVASIETAKKMYSPKRIGNRILTVSRATGIKRYDLLLDAINQIKTKAEWVIIGDGPMLEKIKTEMVNPNVTLNIIGSAWGWARFYYMMTAKVFIFAMGGMPPLEAALLGAMPITIENQATKNLPEFDKFMKYNFGDSLPIFKYDETLQMANKIDEFLNSSYEAYDKEYKTVDKFLSGKTNVTPSSVNAKQIIERIEVICKK